MEVIIKCREATQLTLASNLTPSERNLSAQLPLWRVVTTGGRRYYLSPDDVADILAEE